MIVRWIERKDGSTTHRVVDYKSGEVLKNVPIPKVRDTHQFSISNGFVGTEATKRKFEKADAEKGVSIRYVKTHDTVNYKGERVGAYRAEFNGRAEKNRWLRANNRVDFDASYSDPAPS